MDSRGALAFSAAPQLAAYGPADVRARVLQMQRVCIDMGVDALMFVLGAYLHGGGRQRPGASLPLRNLRLCLRRRFRRLVIRPTAARLWLHRHKHMLVYLPLCSDERRSAHLGGGALRRQNASTVAPPRLGTRSARRADAASVRRLRAHSAAFFVAH